ncbi:uncharacterized protein LOC141686472 [Apium graveolens]|uniref:uncharacterized protein LOC141686472 n=1 Tax=Apium graveolens TaxID=4045 RepID=UPI003D7B519F
MTMSYVDATIGASSSTSGAAQHTQIFDANHLYFLQNFDNPGTLIVTQLLTDQNYNQWSTSVEIALSAKMKLGLIEGTLSKLAITSPLYGLWIHCNNMVLSWLLNSISTEIRNSMAYFTTAKEIWDDFAVRFSQSNMPRTFQFRKELASIQQGSMSITTFFTRFRTLMSKIDNLNPIPKCVCVNNKCACNNAKKLEKYEDAIKLSQFLMGLNDQYTTIRG